MARRVFLHAGLPKTGTTFLQTRMWHNRSRLRRQGFLYPGSIRMDHYRAWQDVQLGPRSGSDRATGAWSRLRDEIDAWDGDALVSHEFFSMATPAQAARVVEDLRPAHVEVVLTVRAYALQLPAVWQEALKMGSRRSFGQFMDAMLAEDRGAGTLRGAWSWTSQDVPDVLERWSSAVPSAQVTVVTVPPPGGPRTLLWDRWCEAVGIDDGALDHHAPFANESLGASQAAFLLRVLPHLQGPLTSGGVRHRWVRQYLGHEVLGPQNGPRFGPRPEQAAQLRALSEDAVAAIAGGGYRVVGSVDDLVPPDTPPADAHPDDVTDADLVEVAARAVEQMVRDVRELTEERDRLRARTRRIHSRLRRLRRRRSRAGQLARTVARRVRVARPSRAQEENR